MEKRLDRLEQRMGAGEPERGQMAFVDLPSWPAAACEAFLAAEAAGDTATADRLVFEHTGVRPTYTGSGVSMVITHLAGTVGEDLAVLKTRYVKKETRR